MAEEAVTSLPQQDFTFFLRYIVQSLVENLWKLKLIRIM